MQQLGLWLITLHAGDVDSMAADRLIGLPKLFFGAGHQIGWAGIARLKGKAAHCGHARVNPIS